ncbi:MAG: MFS transporter [Chthonomonas sp.]|nr:MFS transporter [Chthonomonas sp.]
MPSRAKLWPIYLTVFIDLLSFGLVIPDIQLRGQQLVQASWMVGWMIAAYSAAQLLFSPLLGRLSDQRGRRLILLITSALSCASMAVYAFADNANMMLLARIIGGLGAANLGVAFAYVADVTKPEERAQAMGGIGAAFGVGFIIGPAAGAALASLDHRAYLMANDLPVTAENLRTLAFHGKPLIMGLTASFLSLVNFVFIWTSVPEPESRGAKASGGMDMASLRKALSTQGLGHLLILFFAAGFSFSNLESTYFRLVDARFGLSQQQGTIMLVAVGVATAFMQGYLIRKLLRRYPQEQLLRVSYLLQAPLLLAIPFALPWAPALLGAVSLGLATGMAQPVLSSLISSSAPLDMQGGVFGITQGLGALARILGPALGNWLFGFSPVAPYVAAAVMMLVPVLLAFRFKQPAAGAEPSEALVIGH